MTKKDTLKSCATTLKKIASYSLKNVAASEGATLLADQVRKGLGRNYPKFLKSLPYYKQLEPLVLSTVAYVACEMSQSPKAKLLSRAAQHAITGEIHKLAGPLMSKGRRLVTKLVASPEIVGLMDSLAGEEEAEK